GLPIHGPYTKQWRETFLRKLLEIQRDLQTHGPADLGEIRLISDDELREIRRIWVEEKHEIDDALPRIYEEVTGQPYPYLNDIKPGPFGRDEWNILAEIAREDQVFLQLQASLLDVEQRSRGLTRQKGLLDELEDLLRTALYSSEEEAIAHYKQMMERIGLPAGDSDSAECLPDDNLLEEGFEAE
ncbi:MAG: DNA phosphorothioation system sulfurtransferase DndC, partial [Bacillaceae bacterium]|nr:DNA phosphorothioation system sulfurtransferase DndC [Bacillaceae bacterium]